MSSTSTCCASSFSVKVVFRDVGVIPEAMAAFAACVSVSAVLMIVRILARYCRDELMGLG